MRSLGTLAIALTVGTATAHATTPVPTNCPVSNAGIRFAIVSCPFCSGPSLTLTEQFFDADAVVLAKWTGGERSTQRDPGSTNYEIVDIPRNEGVKLAKGKNIGLPRYRNAKEGDLYVLMGSEEEQFEWRTTLPVTPRSYQYMVKAPSLDVATAKRLEYYLKYLEDSEEFIAVDAYGEFANAPYEDITPLAKKLPGRKLAKWVSNPKTSPTRLGLYGLLLGLCGTLDDAKEMEKFITRSSEDYRLGLDGVASGYLLLTGVKGLDFIERTKLTERPASPNPEAKKLTPAKSDSPGSSRDLAAQEDDQASLSEIYAMVRAIRFMWTYDKASTISKDRLKKSMRLLLKQPRFADLVIPDLARWKDWEVAEELYSMYGKEEFDHRAIKFAIVKFLIHCSQDVPKPEGEVDLQVPVELPRHAKLATELLRKIKEVDPKGVRDAKRTMIF